MTFQKGASFQTAIEMSLIEDAGRKCPTGVDDQKFFIS